ncbi:MAG: DUF3108 domain-containing protein [Oligoflexia bacterium]|nr:DUF3108 domain-containing protein [Oligoflexia bacterium]MBF0366012.1 DUF3108 domain-containing protein [Oligoflexia bacterium]
MKRDCFFLLLALLALSCSPNPYKQRSDPFKLFNANLQANTDANASKLPLKENLMKQFSLEQSSFDKFQEAPVATPKTTPLKKSKQNPVLTPPVEKVGPKAIAIVEEVPESSWSFSSIERKIIKGEYPPVNYPGEFKEYDKRSLPIWKLFTPNIYLGAKTEMTIKYLGINCGNIAIYEKEIVKMGGDAERMAFHFFARVQSAPFYESFYKLDDYVEAFVDIDSFLPIKYTLVQRESKQNVDDLQLFDLDKLVNYYRYKRVKKSETKEESKESILPRLILDSFAPLFFIRGLPLKFGDVYEFPVITRGTVWILKVKVAQEEIVTIQGKNFSAIRLDAETQFPGVLKKRGDINFWVSKDDVRRPLKFMAKVKIGKIEGELTNFTEGTKYVAQKTATATPTTAAAAFKTDSRLKANTGKAGQAKIKSPADI